MSVPKSKLMMAVFAFILYCAGWSEQELEIPWIAAGTGDFARVNVNSSGAQKCYLPGCWAFSACARCISGADSGASASGTIISLQASCNLFELFWIKLLLKCYFVNSHCNYLQVFSLSALLLSSREKPMINPGWSCRLSNTPIPESRLWVISFCSWLARYYNSTRCWDII